jgi:hypothetical protein
MINEKRASLIRHQGIISPPRRDLASGVAFPPEAGKGSFLSFDLEALDRLAAYYSIRLSRRSSAPPLGAGSSTCI